MPNASRSKVLAGVAVCLGWIFLAGCANLQTRFDSVLTSYQGQRYLEEHEYALGVEDLSHRLKQQPDNGAAAYWLGRLYLAQEHPSKALPALQKAVELKPQYADAHFWLGVAHWAMMDFEKERLAYERALALEPDHTQARVYLGHHYVDREQWSLALIHYRRVLDEEPGHPSALFYTAECLEQLGREQSARQAWKAYLDRYPDGGRALEATRRLNGFGDFSYRNIILGKRQVTIEKIRFEQGTATLKSSSLPSLDLIGANLERRSDLRLHVIVYVQEDAALARKRAQAIEEAIVQRTSGADSEQLLLSWFGQAETITVDGERFQEPRSVHFVTEAGTDVS